MAELRSTPQGTGRFHGDLGRRRRQLAQRHPCASRSRFAPTRERRCACSPAGTYFTSGFASARTACMASSQAAYRTAKPAKAIRSVGDGSVSCRYALSTAHSAATTRPGKTAACPCQARRKDRTRGELTDHGRRQLAAASRQQWTCQPRRHEQRQLSEHVRPGRLRRLQAGSAFVAASNGRWAAAQAPAARLRTQAPRSLRR
jgi:hypothetical protein